MMMHDFQEESMETDMGKEIQGNHSGEAQGALSRGPAKPYRAIALLSGGLDSSLAVKMMIDQGIAVTAVHFTSPFCNCTSKNAGCKNQAVKVAQEFRVPIRVIYKGMDYMRMVQSPPHGHGRGMNPCIDCRIYMLKKVKEMMAGSGTSFVVTGEVLGQRPMSQHRAAIQKIEKESELEGRIVRPLSAQHFPPTIPEQEGIVDRAKLLSFSGRSRKPQIGLAEKLGVKDYPCPAGGCLLTDPVIAARLRDLFAHVPDYDLADLHLLKIGRHFRLHRGLKIIVGRDQAENEKIRSLAKSGAILFQPAGFRGPTALACGTVDPLTERKIGEILVRYSQDGRIPYPIQKDILGEGESVFSVDRKFEKEALAVLQVDAIDSKRSS
jgi:tRNA-specific 2-thiouridylase